MDFSVVYKWSKKRKQFVQVQTLQTYCARDWEAFKINRQTYLAVANHRQGKTRMSAKLNANFIYSSLTLTHLPPSSFVYQVTTITP